MHRLGCGAVPWMQQEFPMQPCTLQLFGLKEDAEEEAVLQPAPHPLCP